MLCYHAISPEWPASLSTTPDAFEAQLKLLKRRGYRPVGLTDLALSEESDEKLVAITFDDAFRSVVKLGLPIMERLGFTGTVFAVTSFHDDPRLLHWDGIDQWMDSPHQGELQPMSWEELRELRNRGWEVGSHTLTHPRLSEIDAAELRRELEHSKLACESALGELCTSLAYPYGDHNDEVVAATSAAGYEVAAILPVALRWSTRLRIPRVGVYHADSQARFLAKTLAPIRALRATRLVGELNRRRLARR